MHLIRKLVAENIVEQDYSCSAIQLSDTIRRTSTKSADIKINLMKAMEIDHLSRIVLPEDFWKLLINLKLSTNASLVALHPFRSY